jgi:multidrug transporter EmrE-like cation transporter
MSYRGLVLTVLAALVTVAGNLLMRGGVGRAGGLKLAGATLLPQLLKMGREPMFLAGAVLYALSAVIWFSIISTEPLSTAYPVLVSITFLLVTGGSVFFYQESISPVKGCGILLMLAGIWIVASH